MIRFYTDHLHPVYSKDYTEPKGGAHDNNGSDYFVECFDGKSINYMDLGCAGGAIVEAMHRKGHFAIGLDGSDAQKKQGLNSWGRIPDRLYNADITEPFYFIDEDNNERVKFDVISAWDVLEHLFEERLPSFCENLKNNLKPDGVFVCGIADFPDEGYHVTLHDKQWWIDMFNANGLELVSDEFQEIARKTSFHLKLKIK